MNSPVYKAVFVAMPLTLSQMVYDMSNGAERSRTKAIVSVAGKTYTDEEMEYMAAMRVADSFHLPNKKLKALAAKCPPPPEWLGTEEEMPF